ncbi:hypothetical protein EDB83DRAFT_2318184 [Lactarius deliciosus]|nr:hypothetical protein EDB83DRAFT_2318184 [Lactarius deliciosus]
MAVKPSADSAQMRVVTRQDSLTTARSKARRDDTSAILGLHGDKPSQCSLFSWPWVYLNDPGDRCEGRCADSSHHASDTDIDNIDSVMAEYFSTKFSTHAAATATSLRRCIHALLYLTEGNYHSPEDGRRGYEDEVPRANDGDGISLRLPYQIPNKTTPSPHTLWPIRTGAIAPRKGYAVTRKGIPARPRPFPGSPFLAYSIASLSSLTGAMMAL